MAAPNKLFLLLLALLVVAHPWIVAASEQAPAEADGEKAAAPVEDGAEVPHTHYWWNDVTGESQWEKPEYEFTDPETGNLYYLHPVTKESSWEKFEELEWEEVQEEDKAKGVYYYNAATKSSVWDKPAVLAWRLVAVDERQAQAPSRSQAASEAQAPVNKSKLTAEESEVEAVKGKDEL